jgi:hypothetical protein
MMPSSDPRDCVGASELLSTNEAEKRRSGEAGCEWCRERSGEAERVTRETRETREVFLGDRSIHS